MKHRFYFGDGVYGTYDGYALTLTANGVDHEATDIISLEPGIAQRIADWEKEGFCDYNSGATYREAVDNGQRAR